MTMRTYESIKVALESESNDFEFVDNYRVAAVGNIEEMQEYVNRMSEGCCGSFDTVVGIFTEYNTIKMYLLGFNYGH